MNQEWKKNTFRVSEWVRVRKTRNECCWLYSLYYMHRQFPVHIYKNIYMRSGQTLLFTLCCLSDKSSVLSPSAFAKLKQMQTVLNSFLKKKWALSKKNNTVAWWINKSVLTVHLHRDMRKKPSEWKWKLFNKNWQDQKKWQLKNLLKWDIYFLIAKKIKHEKC